MIVLSGFQQRPELHRFLPVNLPEHASRRWPGALQTVAPYIAIARREYEMDRLLPKTRRQNLPTPGDAGILSILANTYAGSPSLKV